MRKNFFFGLTTLLVIALFALAGCVSTGGSTADVDTYTHASAMPMGMSGFPDKTPLAGAKLQGAYDFLVDSSHYSYTQKDLPSFNSVKYPHGFDENWRSKLNGRVYRGPYYDPLSRSVDWLSINPNGTVDVSLGSYWGMVPPNKDLPVSEFPGYQKSSKYQIFSYNSSGQMTQNWKERKRGTFAIDASLAEYYGIEGNGVLLVEVALNHYTDVVVTPEQYYDGLLPESWSMGTNFGLKAIDPSYPTWQEFWKLSEAQRKDVLAKMNGDAKVKELLATRGSYFWFDILQIVSVTNLIGFEFESANGKVNGIDKDHDGFLDKYPAGHEKAGQPIISKMSNLRVPEYSLYLNFNDGWWYDRWSTPGQIKVVYADGTVVPDPRKK